jgi:5-methylcytosine-specific restriction endonuclease McrA
MTKRKKISPFHRNRIAARQSWKCSLPYCNYSTLDEFFEIDHTLALCNGGSDTLDNCTAVCITCHAKKTRYDLFPHEYEEEFKKSKYFKGGPLYKPTSVNVKINC